MGCIRNGVCSSLVPLFLCQQVTHLAAVMAHYGVSPSRYGSLSELVLFSKFFVGLCNLREICVANMVIQGPPHFVGSVHIACLLLRARSAYGGLSQ